MRPLTSDQLGTSGERQFPNLCDATLTVNKVGEDRTGWDYYVEWPAAEDADVAYDLQPAPLSCHVQVKARWQDSEYIQVSVSSIGRLAKELKPSFVCVLSFDGRKKLAAARVIPVRGQFLADILRQERLAFIEKKKRNKKIFRFKPDDWGTVIDIEDDGFQKFIEDHVGQDLTGYMREKKSEYDNLGYESGRLIVRGKFNGISPRDFRSAFLDQKEIQVEVTSVLDTRFGLNSPSKEIPAGPATAKFNLAGGTPGSMSLWPDPTGPAVVYEGTWRPLPQFLAESGHVESVFQTELITVVAKAPVVDGTLDPEGMTMSLEIDGAHVVTAQLKPAQWRDFYHIMAKLALGSIKFGIQLNGKTAVAGQLHVDRLPGDDLLYARVDRLAQIAEKAFSIAGASNVRLGVNDFYLQGPALLQFEAMWTQPFDGSLSFVTEQPDGFKGQESLTALYFGTVPMGAHAVVYCAEVDFISSVGETGLTWASTAVRPREVIRIEAPTSEVLDETTVGFLDQMRLSTGIDSYFFAALPEPLKIEQA